MKKNVMKTMVAAVCVVAAGMGGFKAYGFANQSQADMLLAENVEALSQKDGGDAYGESQAESMLTFEELQARECPFYKKEAKCPWREYWMGNAGRLYYTDHERVNYTRSQF